MSRSVHTGGLLEITGLRLIVFCLVSSWFLWPYLDDPTSLVPTGDYSFFVNHAISTYRSVVEFHQAPLWDPYNCGGVPALGNIQSHAFAPGGFLVLMFGPMAGLKLMMFTYQVIGMEGAYRYARKWDAGSLAAVVAGVLFAVDGRMVSAWTAGQPVLSTFMLTPLLLLCFERSVDDLRWSVGIAGVMTWIFFEGGAVATLYLAIVLAAAVVVQTIVLLVQKGRSVPLHRPLLAVSLAATLTASLSAVRLWPVVDTFLQAERHWPVEEAYGFKWTGRMLFVHGWGDEHTSGSSFIGLIAAITAGLAGIRLRRHRRRKWLFYPVINTRVLPLAAMAYVALDLSMAYAGPLGLFRWVKAIPIVGGLRHPWRLHVVLSLYVAVGVAIVLTRGYGWLVSWARTRQRPPGDDVGGRRRPWATGLLLSALAPGVFALWAIAAVAPSFSYNRARIASIEQLSAPIFSDQPFRQTLGNRWDIHVWAAFNLGSLQCIEAQNFPVSVALRADLPQEEYLADATAGRVERIFWSPNVIRLAVDLDREATVVVNQNAHPGWTVSEGRMVEYHGLIAARVPAGTHEVALRFSDEHITAGAVISALSMLGLVSWWFWSARGRRRSRHG